MVFGRMMGGLRAGGGAAGGGMGEGGMGGEGTWPLRRRGMTEGVLGEGGVIQDHHTHRQQPLRHRDIRGKPAPPEEAEEGGQGEWLVDSVRGQGRVREQTRGKEGEAVETQGGRVAPSEGDGVLIGVGAGLSITTGRTRSTS